MNRLDEILLEMRIEAPNLSFSQILRHTREKLGLRQYSAAEHLRMTMARLKNLETGYFRDMPKLGEVKEISDLYKVPFDMLIEKAEKHVKERKKSIKRGLHNAG